MCVNAELASLAPRLALAHPLPFFLLSTGGWGLPLLERKRLRLEIDGHYEESTPSSPVGPSHPHGHSHHHHASDSAQMAHHHHHHHQHADAPHIPTVLSAGPVASGSSSSSSTSRQVDSATLTPNRRKRGTPDASASDSDEPGPSSKRRLTPLRSPSGSPPPPGTTLVPLTAAKAKAGGPCRTLTRPWKDVYTERLIIERNWRKGRYESKTLKGHSNSIMCLQVLESESWMAAGCDAKGKDRATNRSGPSGVLITGSYDRTARVWDLESGKEVMVSPRADAPDPPLDRRSAEHPLPPFAGHARPCTRHPGAPV